MKNFGMTTNALVALMPAGALDRVHSETIDSIVAACVELADADIDGDTLIVRGIRGDRKFSLTVWDQGHRPLRTGIEASDLVEALSRVPQARTASGGLWGDGRRWLCDVAAEIGTTPDGLTEVLLQARRDGVIRIDRCDMVGMAPILKLDASQWDDPFGSRAAYFVSPA